MSLYCTNCGAEVDESTKFCASCGQPINRPPSAETKTADPAAAKAPMLLSRGRLIALCVAAIVILAAIGGFAVLRPSPAQETTQQDTEPIDIVTELLESATTGDLAALRDRIPDSATITQRGPEGTRMQTVGVLLGDGSNPLDWLTRSDMDTRFEGAEDVGEGRLVTLSMTYFPGRSERDIVEITLKPIAGKLGEVGFEVVPPGASSRLKGFAGTIVFAETVDGWQMSALDGKYTEPSPPSSTEPPNEVDAELACQGNLRTISGAAQTFASINANGSPPQAIADLVPSIIKTMPVCPSGGSYDYDPEDGTVSCTVHGSF